MQKVKWGVLGTANIAKGCTIPGMKLAENCELYAIAGRNEEKAKAFQEEFGFTKAYGSYEALLEDPEVQAVYIPLPNGLHFDWVKAALEKKKHVLCEKPLALNASDARALFQTAEDNGVYLMEAYAYLHSPYVKNLKADVENGVIGKIDHIEAAFLTQSYKEDIRLYKELGGGAMYDLGCYCTTMILSLHQDEIEAVKAVAEFSNRNVDQMTSAILRFRSGVRASFKVGMILGEGSDDRFDYLYVHGDKGCIRSEVEFNQAGELSYKIFTAEGVTERKLSAPQNYSLEVTQLGKCILDGEEPYVTRDFSVKNAELMDKVFQEIGY